MCFLSSEADDAPAPLKLQASPTIADLLREQGRFETMCMPEPNSGCWIWLNYVDKKGYGKLSKNRAYYLAHRYSYEIYKGQIGPGLYACHECDTPQCVNPDHIFIGTAKDNSLDMVKKSRNAWWEGEEHVASKLTAEQVLAIRADQRSSRAIAPDYGVAPSYVSQIKRCRTWKNI